MNKFMDSLVICLGRSFIGVFFVWQALFSIFNWEASLSILEEKKIAMSTLILILGIMIELLSGILFIIGYKIRFVVCLMILWLLFTSFFLHNFWIFNGAKSSVQFTYFLEKFAMIGSCLLLIVWGPGKMSIDRK